MKQMGMDKKIKKKKWDRTKTIYLAGTITFLVLAFFGFKAINKKTYRVNASKISVKKVISGDFQDVILIDGNVEPINLVLVNTLSVSVRSLYNKHFASIWCPYHLVITCLTPIRLVCRII